jgi:hypothetical protein
MYSTIVLFAFSLLIGFAFGRFSWHAIAISGLALAVLAAVVLHGQGFGPFAGIAIIVACLTLNQLAYFVSLLSRGSERAARQSIERAKDAEARSWSKSH